MQQASNTNHSIMPASLNTSQFPSVAIVTGCWLCEVIDFGDKAHLVLILVHLSNHCKLGPSLCQTRAESSICSAHYMISLNLKSNNDDTIQNVSFRFWSLQPATLNTTHHQRLCASTICTNLLPMQKNLWWAYRCLASLTAFSLTKLLQRFKLHEKGWYLATKLPSAPIDGIETTAKNMRTQ